MPSVLEIVIASTPPMVFLVGSWLMVRRINRNIDRAIDSRRDELKRRSEG